MTSSLNPLRVPPGAEIRYAPDDHPYIRAAHAYAARWSLDPQHPTGAVWVVDGEIKGRGANGSIYHSMEGCKRKHMGIPSGEGYELCHGCRPCLHAEQRAVRDARRRHPALTGGELWLWGHWWCCPWCWEVMLSVGITTVWLPQSAQVQAEKAESK